MSVIRSIFSVWNNYQTITVGYDCPGRQQTWCQEGNSKSLFCKYCIISKFSLFPPTIFSTMFCSCIVILILTLYIVDYVKKKKKLYLLCRRITGDSLALLESLTLFLFFLFWCFDFFLHQITNLIAPFYFPICPRVSITFFFFSCSEKILMSD